MNFVQPIRDPEKLRAIKEWLYDRNKRDWLLLVTGINTGLRISDLLKLQAKDTRQTHLLLRETKSGQRKWIRISPSLRRAFDEYASALPDDAWLFPSRQGNNRPLSRVRAYAILREAAAANGVASIGTHSLRKTFGWHFYRQHRDVALLQELFGHSNQSTTLRYIGVNQDVMDDAMRRFSL